MWVPGVSGSPIPPIQSREDNEQIIMNKFDYEINYLKTILPELENYLLSTDLYRVIFIPSPRGNPAYPSLSLGTVLFSLKKAHGYGVSEMQNANLLRIENEINIIQNHWRQAWENKALREIPNRANLWQAYLSDLIANYAEQKDRYDYEVRHRTIIELLHHQISKPESIRMANLNLLDQILQPSFSAGKFIWDSELAEEFPAQPFWFLWGKPLKI